VIFHTLHHAVAGLSSVRRRPVAGIRSAPVRGHKKRPEGLQIMVRKPDFIKSMTRIAAPAE
jgi:hypothetical protein